MPRGLQSAAPARRRRPIPFGKYELLERINIGGMAEILKARDISLPDEPIVAVKRILPHLTDDRQFVTMFLDESRVLAQLEHDNIIRTLEVGQVGETPFIALEYVWGQDARMLFHRARRTEQPIPQRVACFVIAQVCAALHHAHERTDAQGDLLGLVHRDISLQNILLSYDGAVKLTDFGIAMSAENKARTEVGIVKGKFGYMSPEQIRGEPMDRRSDVFATGICLYELLTSERLFSGDSDYAAVEKVRSVAVEPPSRWNREISSELEAIVMKALAKHPRDRFQNAAELRRALLALMTESQNECSANDLADHMRAVFAEELRKAPTPEVLKREIAERAGEPTGLAAFDNLDPISTISGASAVHASPALRAATADTIWNPRGGPDGAPSVPPIVPRRDSVPAPAPQSEVFARPGELVTGEPFAPAAEPDGVAASPPASVVGIGLDWDDDEARTSTARREPVDALEADEQLASEDDVTRQIQVGETFSGVTVVGASGMRPAAVATSAPALYDLQASAQAALQEPEERGVMRSYPPPRRPLPQTSYSLVIAIVVGIVLVIAGALYATRDSRPAAVSLSTAPADAFVRVDGKVLAQRESPFHIGDLAPGVPHRIEVFKDGYRGWSTRIALEPGQELRLPLVDLAPEAPEASLGVGLPPGAGEPRGVPLRRPGASPVRPAQRSGAGNNGPRTAPRPQQRESAKSAPAQSRARGGDAAGGKAGAERAAGTGVLRLNSRPWSEVAIDGKPAGNTPLMNVSLPAGQHTIKLVNPQFNLKKTIKVQIEPGKTLTKVVDLQ